MSAVALARMVSFAFVGVSVTSTAACSENCEVTRGLYEPFVAAISSPETFDDWLDDHPAYFTRARVNCLIKKEEGAYARERELLRWLSAGHSNAQIAGLRQRSPATVRNQLWALYQKLGVGRRTEAIAKAVALNMWESKS